MPRHVSAEVQVVNSAHSDLRSAHRELLRKKSEMEDAQARLERTATSEDLWSEGLQLVAARRVRGHARRSTDARMAR